MSFFSDLSKRLTIRKSIPPELQEEFIRYKDIKSIDRIQTSAWIGVALTVCILVLDYYRMQTIACFWDDRYYRKLFYFHLMGFLFFIPAVYTTLRKEWIIQQRLRRGVVIWGMVVLTIIYMMGQATLTYLQRDSLVFFLGYVFIFNWMFSMSHKERVYFSVFSFTVMALTIFYLKSESLEFHIKITHFIEVFFLSLTAFIFDAYDFNLKWANFMHQKEIEREQGQVRKLEEFKSRFFTNLTHELRTPLTIISGMAKEISEDPHRWSHEGTEIIQRNSGNLLNLVNQILALSKIESDSLPIHLTKGDLISYFGYIVDAFKGHAVAKQIKLHYLSSEDEWNTSYDPEKFMNILSNLISNAIKFTPEGGNIYVELERSKKNGEEFIEIIVRDTGIGIPKDDQEHIFERFYQAQNEHTSSGLGTGIGLSLVYELVKLLSGEIRVKSTVGKGTTFTVTLPVQKDDGVNGMPVFKEDIRANVHNYLPPLTKETQSVLEEAKDDKPEVLIIDDNADVLKYLQICLSDIYQLTFCKNGQEGIDMAIEKVPDLILSDVLMPIKDGLTVTKELKNHPITSHIPIVLLSAKVDPESRIAGLQAGADVYRLKPFEKQDLRLQLHNLLERRQEFRQRYADPTQPPEATQEKSISNEDQFIQKARAIVMEHLDDSEFSVTDFCRALFLSRTQLHKKLTALTGLSATLFIRQIRLLVAKKKMATPELSISDIAYQVGFTDPNYFTRCYVQEFGESPSETRNSMNIKVL